MFVGPSVRLSLSRELEGQAMDIRGETKQRGERGLRLCRPPVLLSRRPAPLSPTVPHGRLSTQTERKRGKRARQLPPARKVSDRRRIVIPSVRPSFLPPHHPSVLSSSLASASDTL